MGFRINTNIAALSSHNNATMTNRALDKSLGALSSGLRINSAADDASGMAIADSLRSQANSLGQAVRNANDAIGIIQTADKAMDEQLKILDTIKTKAIQAASATQTGASREAIQQDVNRLIEQLDNIALTTTFNGQTLLDGTYSNKSFQVGAYSNQTIAASIGNTQSVATGNISTREDIAQLGNTGNAITAAQGATQITLSSSSGVAIGDTIRIDGVGNYEVTTIASAASSADGTLVVTLDRGLETKISATKSFSIVSNADENLKYAAPSANVLSSGGDFTITFTDASGLAVGDTMRITNSAGESMTVKITEFTAVTTAGGATVQFSGGSGAGAIETTANISYSMAERNALGTSFSGTDYVQYTVDDIDLTGVQMTDEDGNGIAGTGLGAVADQINSLTGTTGIKATADNTLDSQSIVQGMALTSDITINGTTILSSGDTILEGDTNNKLVDAINAETSNTGVTASLEADGSLTLVSDGRAMNLSGLSGVANISDGIHAGTLNITGNTVGSIDISAKHYVDAQLTQASSAKNMEEVEKSTNVAEIVSGKVDDNGDGLIDDDDTVGLLRTQTGAQVAMDIIDAAIQKLDSTRAGLGSSQNQLVVTVNNISVTQVNVKAAESQIRDVDFAAESANFSRLNILAQSGSYALSQANAVQQNVLRLLQ